MSWTERTNRFSGACRACVYPVVRELDEAGDLVSAECPGCGEVVRLERLYAVWNSGIACNPACQGALRPECECSCGGANHQVRWLPTCEGELPASRLAEYRRTTERRKAAAAETQRRKREAKAAELRRGQLERLRELPVRTQVVLLEDDVPAEGPEGELLAAVRGHRIAGDIRRRFWAEGRLSDSQAELLGRLVDQEREHRARQAADEARTWGPAPSGRLELVGEVLSTKWAERPMYHYNDSGETLKMLVRVDDPAGSFKVWATVPDGLTLVGEPRRGLERGDRVSFSATLEPSDRDETFAFAKRPTRARWLGPAEDQGEAPEVELPAVRLPEPVGQGSLL